MWSRGGLADSTATGAAGSVITDPRVDVGVDEVGDDVHEDEGDREYHDRTLDRRIVPRADRLHQQPAHPGPGEDGLGDDGAAEKLSELQTDDGDDRQGGVAQSVAEHDGTTVESL